ncbi:hypothetical protein BH11VER1_BH11VER1_29440 [soil metagenome]
MFEQEEQQNHNKDSLFAWFHFVPRADATSGFKR